MLRAISFILVAFLLVVAPAKADERILSFESDVTVEATGTFLVKETIEVRAEGRQIRRGIFRDFPTVFTDDSDRERNVDFELIGVTRDGQPENAAVEKSSRFVRIRIGRADVFLSANTYTYEITYRTDRQLRRFETHDEVFWNVTGNAWAFPIDRASAIITLPAGASAEDTIFFTGRLGAKEKNARQNVTADGRIAVFETTKSLAPREGLTVGVKFTKGVIPAVSSEQKLKWLLQDYLAEILVFGGAAIVFFYYLWAWMRVGRDPPKDTIVPRWDLPGNISPALSHYIYRKGLRNRGFTALSAAALSLAVKGRVTLDNDGTDLTINKVKGATANGLPVGEASLISRLNGQGGSLKIDKAHGKTVQAMASKFSSALTSEHRSVFYNSNAKYAVVGVIISAVLAVLAVVSGRLNEETIVIMAAALIAGIAITIVSVNLGRGLMSGGLGGKIRAVFGLFIASSFIFNVGIGSIISEFPEIANPWLFGGIASIAMINVLFFFLIGAPTPIGQKRMAEVEGLRRYMSVAEEDRMNMLGSPEMSPKHYETLLPYAVALECEKPWSNAFQGWLAAAVAAGAATAVAYHGPSWYSGNDKFSPDTIGDTMGNIGSDMASSMTSSLPAPKSSSSGFSGGGSSGGGGGGGGGGGW